MNYERVYDQFVIDRRRKEAALIRDNRHLWQSHHIIPRSVGGGNGRDNLIRLTHEDHLFAHLLLGKIYGGYLWAAALLMLGEEKIGRKARRRYDFARRAYSRAQSERLTGKPGFMTGRKHSAETRAKLSASHKGLPQSEETKKKRAATLIGNKHRLGKPVSEATRELMRQRMMGNKSRTGQIPGALERQRRSESGKRSWTAERHEQHQAMLKRRWAKYHAERAA